MYNLFVVLLGLVFAMTCNGVPNDDIAKEIISMEQAALDRWCKGDPWGFAEIYADEVTYFSEDTERRLDGLETMRHLFTPIEGKIKIEKYEMINPKVQIHGDTAVLSYIIINYVLTAEGLIKEKEIRWNSTEVYSRINGEWKIIHSHWSHTKQKASE